MPVFGEDQNKKRAAPFINEIVGRVNDNTKRLRLIEQREKILTSRASSMDETIREKSEVTDSAIKELKEKVTSQDEKISTIQNTMKEVVNQLHFLAKKSEIKKVEETLKIFEDAMKNLASGN